MRKTPTPIDDEIATPMPRPKPYLLIDPVERERDEWKERALAAEWRCHELEIELYDRPQPAGRLYILRPLGKATDGSDIPF